MAIAQSLWQESSERQAGTSAMSQTANGGNAIAFAVLVRQIGGVDVKNVHPPDAASFIIGGATPLMFANSYTQRMNATTSVQEQGWMIKEREGREHPFYATGSGVKALKEQYGIEIKALPFKREQVSAKGRNRRETSQAE